MKKIVCCLATLVLMGCNQGTQSPSGEEQKSGIQDVVDTMSQRKALEDGRKAGQQIRQIRADQDKNMQEVDQ
jgi:hypothetical protein